MVADTSEYRFLSGAFQVLYKDRETQLRGNPPDMLSGLELKKYWQDPSQRFLPPDFQDFWICQDVQAMFFHLGRRLYTSTSIYNYCNPKVQYTPQVDNYAGYAPVSEAYGGYYVKYPSYRFEADSFYYNTEAYSLMSCEPDAPGLLSTIGDQLVYVGDRGSQSFTYRANAKVYSTISDQMEIGTIDFFNDARVEGHPASAYMPLQSPAYTEALSTKLSAHQRKVFQVGNVYSNCYAPEQASATIFNDIDQFEHMWCFLDDSSVSCCNMRNRKNNLTSDYVVTYYNYSHRIMPWQEANWYNEHVPDTYGPYMYRQFIGNEVNGGIPASDGEGKNYRLYAQAPAYCFYGDLSADVYLMWRVSFGSSEPVKFYARKMTVEFERSDYYCVGNTPYIARYALRSKQTWSYKELFCLWEPLNLNSIPTVANNLRAMAGLSAWAFPTGDFPEDDWDVYPQRSITINWESPFIVWKFSHPLLKGRDYHFTN